MPATRRVAKPKFGHEPNYTLISLLILLLGFGLIMLMSASAMEGWEKFRDVNYYVKHQLLYGVAIGLPVMWVMSRVDYHLWKQYAFPLMVTSVILLLLVLMPGIGVELLGAKRWVDIGGILFQPSELVKIIFLIYLGVWLESKEHDLKDAHTGLIPFLIMVGFLVVMIAGVQKDLGTMIVIGVIALAAYFIAEAPWKHLLIIGVLSILGLVFIVGVLPRWIPSFQYRADRITVFLNPEIDVLGDSYQINQALLAIGSGGPLGVGLGQSIQKRNYLPEAASDSIFAIIAEEMGFIVAVGLIILYALFMMQGYKVAREAPDVFGKIVAGGITTWVVFQATVNIMAMLALLPLTGIPLPFVSYGSTSLVTLLAAMGILVNISRQTK